MKRRWKRVIIESPFGAPDKAGVEENRAYLRACIRDCILRGESPYASHGLLPGALDDRNPEERALGIEAGFAWRGVAAATVVYLDRGVSVGMKQGLERPVQDTTIGTIEFRALGGPDGRGACSIVLDDDPADVGCAWKLSGFFGKTMDAPVVEIVAPWPHSWVAEPNGASVVFAQIDFAKTEATNFVFDMTVTAQAANCGLLDVMRKRVADPEGFKELLASMRVQHPFVLPSKA